MGAAATNAKAVGSEALEAAARDDITKLPPKPAAPPSTTPPSSHDQARAEVFMIG
jgi:hypothetical protein